MSFAGNAKINVSNDGQLGACFILQSSNSTCSYSYVSLDMSQLHIGNLIILLWLLSGSNFRSAKCHSAFRKCA